MWGTIFVWLLAVGGYRLTGFSKTFMVDQIHFNWFKDGLESGFKF